MPAALAPAMTSSAFAAAAASTETGGQILSAVEWFALLLGIAAFVALAARRLNVPYSVALVLVGLVVSIFAPQTIEISPELVLAVLLPGLVFEAAYQMDVRALRGSLTWVAVLAAPGVVVSAAIVAVVLHLATGMALSIAFVVGAIVSATDPVAVVAIFSKLHAPPRLATLVEAESLFNDGTGIVIFAIALSAVSTPVAPAEAILTFVLTVLVSGAIGIAAGFVASRIVARVDDHLVELTISVVLAYGTYLLADRLHESGIIATVVAGAILGSYGRRTAMAPRTEEALDTVWEFIAFILNTIVFLLIGAATSIHDLVASLGPIAWGVVAVLVGRALVVYGLLGIPARIAHLRAGTEALPLAWLHVMFWAGLRGAVAAALALSLPESFPDRATVQGIVFGIVLFTLLVQGSTAELVLRRSGVSADPSDGSDTPDRPEAPETAQATESAEPA